MRVFGLTASIPRSKQTKNIIKKRQVRFLRIAEDKIGIQKRMPPEDQLQELDAEMLMAANDPLFLADQEEINQAFASADAETARNMENT